MDSSSSSKVTVEYHDPSGIFPLVAPSIAARLPLRNLNWQSPSRPLRQIKSLHLDFVPDDFTRASLRPPTSQTESEASNSFDLVRNGASATRKDGKERRHQIPGLQTSPYVKIYVLRCDDKDAYKATERGKIRQWIRDNAASAASKKKSSNQNENHTASEYLILHVVVPDTVAASEPRWRESQREPDELKERKQGAKWPGKSTRTVFDKLRADFNDSSKTDRVAQLRLSKDDVPADLLPTPSQAVTYNETAEEQGKTWNDLLTKLKSSILVPFDKRVRQYEQDIAEQESRRALPGFNFCTFFIHKEGLARALEAIGLVEDALVIYDELSLGLDSVLHDLASGQAEGTATIFAGYTDDVRERIVNAGKNKSNGVAGHSRDDSETFDSGEIDYRERIVRSNISVFDFQCYLFARRKALILRLANAVAARQQLGSMVKDGGEDLILISEVCWRASNFLHNTARVLRQDLLAARTAGRDDLSSEDVDALVCSWLYTVAGQILDETAASALDSQSESEHSRKPSIKSPPNGTVTSPRRSEFADLGSATAYPQRTTSLPARKSRVSELQNSRISMHSASEDTLVSPPSSSGADGSRTFGQLPGLPELVTYRAELVMMRRKMLEQLAMQHGWLAGWASLHAERSHLESINLNGDDEQKPSKDQSNESKRPSTLLPATLTASLLSEEIFHESYDRLSDQAMRYYHSATQTKSAEAIVGDLAVLKYQQGDWDFASKYFEHVLASYRDEGWAAMEIEAMQILRVCWRELGKINQELAVVLDMAERQVATAKEAHGSFHQLDREDLALEAVNLSENLDQRLVLPAERLFGDVSLEREIIHFAEHDGFALNLSLQHFLDDFQLDEVAARLVHAEDINSELSLVTSRPPILKRGHNQIRLESSISAYGPYLIDSVVLKAKNIHFAREFQASTKPDTSALGIDVDPQSGISAKSHGSPWVFIYPVQQAFHADVQLARDVRIDKLRHLVIHFNSGWNEISSLDLRLKPASAGLRLHLADAQLEGVERRTPAESKSGVMPIGSVTATTDATVTVPYSLDHPSTREIVIHLTAQYETTSSHASTFTTTAKLPTELPLDVDVNDIFHDEALFSNFTIRATSKSPLAISQATLRPSTVYNVETPPALGTMTVFEEHPVNLAYKITRNGDAAASRSTPGKGDAALALSVDYVAVEDIVAAKVGRAFAQALERSTFGSFRRLLCPLLVSRLRQVISRPTIEMAALLGEVRLPSFEMFGWAEIVNTLPAVVRPKLVAWMKKWHDDHASIALELDSPARDHGRSITISVEVPTMDFVHRASLSILNPLYDLDADGQILALGQPVDAVLEISSTTIWSKGSIFDASEADGSDDFIYDIQADADSWLVGGSRRARLTAAHRSHSTFSVTLVPLRLGPLYLPLVDVHSASAAANEGSDGEKEGGVRCETHCASAGQVVRVIKNEHKTKVEISESATEQASGGQIRTASSPGTSVPERGASRPGTTETTYGGG